MMQAAVCAHGFLVTPLALQAGGAGHHAGCCWKSLSTVRRPTVRSMRTALLGARGQERLRVSAVNDDSLEIVDVQELADGSLVFAFGAASEAGDLNPLGGGPDSTMALIPPQAASVTPVPVRLRAVFHKRSPISVPANSREHARLSRESSSLEVEVPSRGPVGEKVSLAELSSDDAHVSDRSEGIPLLIPKRWPSFFWKQSPINPNTVRKNLRPAVHAEESSSNSELVKMKLDEAGMANSSAEIKSPSPVDLHKAGQDEYEKGIASSQHSNQKSEEIATVPTIRKASSRQDTTGEKPEEMATVSAIPKASSRQDTTGEKPEEMPTVSVIPQASSRDDTGGDERSTAGIMASQNKNQRSPGASLQDSILRPEKAYETTSSMRPVNMPHGAGQDFTPKVKSTSGEVKDFTARVKEPQGQGEEVSSKKSQEKGEVSSGKESSLPQMKFQEEGEFVVSSRKESSLSHIKSQEEREEVSLQRGSSLPQIKLQEKGEEMCSRKESTLPHIKSQEKGEETSSQKGSSLPPIKSQESGEDVTFQKESSSPQVKYQDKGEKVSSGKGSSLHQIKDTPKKTGPTRPASMFSKASPVSVSVSSNKVRDSSSSRQSNTQVANSQPQGDGNVQVKSMPVRLISKFVKQSPVPSNDAATVGVSAEFRLASDGAGRADKDLTTQISSQEVSESIKGDRAVRNGKEVPSECNATTAEIRDEVLPKEPQTLAKSTAVSRDNKAKRPAKRNDPERVAASKAKDLPSSTLSPSVADQTGVATAEIRVELVSIRAQTLATKSTAVNGDNEANRAGKLDDFDRVGAPDLPSSTLPRPTADEDGGESSAESKVAGVEDLSSLKLADLKSMAKSRGLKGYSKLRKGELIELLSSLE